MSIMAALDQTRANQVIDAIHGTAALVATTTPLHVRYMTANGTNTTNGTELVTGGGYTSGTGAPTMTCSAATGGSNASNAAVTTTNMPATTINGIETWDSNATPKRQTLGPLTAAKTTNAGDTFTIGSGSYTYALT